MTASPSKTFVQDVIEGPERPTAEQQAGLSIARSIDIENLDTVTARTLFVVVAAKVLQDSGGDAIDLMNGVDAIIDSYDDYKAESDA